MRKLLSILLILTSCSIAADRVERDSNGKLLSTTTAGVRRDTNGQIIDSRSTDRTKTETRRDPNGKILSVKPKQ